MTQKQLTEIYELTQAKSKKLKRKTLLSEIYDRISKYFKYKGEPEAFVAIVDIAVLCLANINDKKEVQFHSYRLEGINDLSIVTMANMLVEDITDARLNMVATFAIARAEKAGADIYEFIKTGVKTGVLP